MRLSFGQELRMAQKQVLAPRMIQSMEILQLPIMELQARIDQEILENPILEQQEDDLDLPEERLGEGEGEGVEDNPNAPTAEERELVVDETKNNEDDFERLVTLEHGGLLRRREVEIGAPIASLARIRAGGLQQVALPRARAPPESCRARQRLPAACERSECLRVAAGQETGEARGIAQASNRIG
jgi:hypothetical protein